VYRVLWLFAPIFLIVALALTGILQPGSLGALGGTVAAVIVTFVVICVVFYRRGQLSLESAHMSRFVRYMRSVFLQLQTFQVFFLPFCAVRESYKLSDPVNTHSTPLDAQVPPHVYDDLPRAYRPPTVFEQEGEAVLS
jgi:hypothetical protein